MSVFAGEAFHGHSLLAVFAHPDDESLASGGLLACCAARGARVSLLCLSRGEIGPGVPADGLPDLASTRACELDAAADALGLTEVRLRTHPDGMLPWVGTGVLASDIRHAIQSTGADVIITFDDDGLYWHPDHVAVHTATNEVVAAMGRSGPALYYVTMPPGQMRAVVETATRRRDASTAVSQRDNVLGVGDPDAFGASAHSPTLVVRTGRFARRKLEALRCHRTQVATGPFDYLTDDDAEVLLAEEHYRRAAIGSVTPSFIDRLGVLVATP